MTRDQEQSVYRARGDAPGSLWRAGIVPAGLLGVFLFLLGGTWDVSWHIDIGRDTFFSPPHLMLYAGLLLIGLTPLFAVFHARRLAHVPAAALAGPTVRVRGIPVSPAVIVGGIGALLAFGAAPIDELWHQVFGLDVTIWSPPHIQLIFGAVLACLAQVTALAGELNRAQPQRLLSSKVTLETKPLEVAQIFGLAMLIMTLGATLSEYSFGIAQHALYWHPILLPVVSVGGLFLAARTLGFAWGATAVAVAYALLDNVFLGFLVTIGRSIPVLPAFIPAAVVIDLLWTQRGQRIRHAALPALVGTLVLLGTQFEYLGRDAGLPWPVQSWVWLLPAALVSGLVGALAGARIGAALRPTVVTSTLANGHPHYVAGSDAVLPLGQEVPVNGETPTRRQRGTVPMAAGTTLGALLMLATATVGTLTVQAHTGPGLEAHAREPHVTFHLISPPPAAGETAQFALQFAPANIIDPSTIQASLKQGDTIIPVHLQLGNAPGTIIGTATPPRQGSWTLPLRFQDLRGQRWLGWASLRAASPEQTWRPAIPWQEIKLQPDRTRILGPQDQLGLTLGKILVGVVIVACVAGGLFALRAVEQDGLRYASRQVASSE